jgi:hypothetical protein
MEDIPMQCAEITGTVNQDEERARQVRGEPSPARAEALRQMAQIIADSYKHGTLADEMRRHRARRGKPYESASIEAGSE